MLIGSDPHPLDARTRSNLVRRLLVWYDRHARVLPWRAPSGEPADPYRVWLSEIMLQQTTVATVSKRFDEFLGRWPDFGRLARADLDEVLAAWAGLGYYARARNLHRCAREIVERHAGRLPSDAEALRRLPGIGAYTAGAIAAIAFDRRAAAIDGNVERVLCRLYAIDAPLATIKGRLRALAEDMVPKSRPGDWAQALMDLGATICTPRSPDCRRCPLASDCAARHLGIAQELPRKRPRSRRPERHGVAFWIADGEGRVMVRRRPPEGLLGGMLEFPGTPWRDGEWLPREALRHAPCRARWNWIDGEVRHVFTHFGLTLRVVAGVAKSEISGVEWRAIDGLHRLSLPTVMRKVADLARASASG